MNTLNNFNDISIPLSQVFDQLGCGAMLIKENSVVLINKNLSQIAEIETHKPYPDLNTLFPEDKFENLSETIYNTEATARVIHCFSLKALKTIWEIKITGFDFNGQKYKSVLFNQINSKNNKELMFDYFSELTADILLETDASGKIISHSKSFENIFKNEEKYQGNDLNLIDLIEDESVEKTSMLFNHTQDDNIRGQVDITLINRTGEPVKAEMHYQKKLCNSVFEGIICLISDNRKQRKLEIRYQQNQKRLRTVLDLVPHMIFLKDLNGKILLANKACADFYKSTTKELVYSNIADFHKNKNECQRILAEDIEVISSKSGKEWHNLELTDNENNKYIYKTTKVPFIDPETGQVHSLGISVDITSQKQEEAETTEAKEKFRILVERGSDGIVILQGTKIAYANRQTARMFGYQLEEFITKPLSSLFKRNQLKKTFDQFLQNSQKRAPGNYYEMEISKPDGTVSYVEAKVNTINYLGKKSRLIFLRDITTRKISEKNTERYKNMLEQAQKIANLGTWEWNINERTLYCSEEIFKILEIEYDETITRDAGWLASFIPDKFKNKVFRGLIGSIKDGNKLDIEFPIISLTGNKKTIHSQSQVFFSSKKAPERITGTWIDITQHIEFAKVLKEARLRAEESDNLKSAFLSNMSHEIRTPMNAILGFAKLLKNRDINDITHHEYIDHILQSGEGLIKLINDIIDISKIESNQLTIEKAPVRINEVLDQLSGRYEEILLIEQNCNISLILEKALPDPNFMLMLDSFRIQQVLSYLLTNAIKFTPKGTISFGYSIRNQEIIFFVKDQGIGIPENKKEMIFKSFGKLEGPQRMNKSGTGLGLSISKSLVGLMGGSIWFETSENKGTKFYFSLPLEFSSQKPVVKKEITASPHEKIELRKKTILIAEDEMLNYKLLEALLKKTGAEILWAKNGLEAVNFVSSNKIDLIFMDIKMPEMNGYEATKAIKLLDPSIPIIAQTAFAFSNEQQYILQSGCDMYLTKPINHIEVYKALDNFLVP